MSEEKKKSKGGRPCEYTTERGDRICEAVATTPRGIRRILAEHDDFPALSCLMNWRNKFPLFEEQYLVAKQKQAELFAEQTIDIADEATREDHMVAKLRIQTRQWHAAKLSKIYGDKKEDEKKDTKEEVTELLKSALESAIKEKEKDY